MREETRKYLIDVLKAMGVAIFTGGFLGHIVKPEDYTGLLAMAVGGYLLLLGALVVEMTGE